MYVNIVWYFAKIKRYGEVYFDVSRLPQQDVRVSDSQRVNPTNKLLFL